MTHQTELFGNSTQLSLEQHLQEAERKAWDSLARYKFQMFGYWAAIWVHLNRIGKFGLPNPFSDLVRLARKEPSLARKLLEQHKIRIEHGYEGLPQWALNMINDYKSNGGNDENL